MGTELVIMALAGIILPPEQIKNKLLTVKIRGKPISEMGGQLVMK
jgi:hypothetical protein